MIRNLYTTVEVYKTEYAISVKGVEHNREQKSK